MPLINRSTYRPKKIYQQEAHLSTIIPARLKKHPIPNYTRKKLELDDGDFLNLDWRKKEKSNKIVILCHGLEGDSKRTYLNSCSDYFYERDFSVLAWNYRSCGGEMNRLKRLYHHGAYDDLERVVNHLISLDYTEIALVGFSMGGALLMNYLGNVSVPKEVKVGVGISVPISLKSSADRLKAFPNVVYFQNFKRTLLPKIIEKAKQFPGAINLDLLKKVRSFDQIDDYVTAPLHNYPNKEAYYTEASPKHCLHKIRTPCLVVNAKNDPFLGKECYDVSLFENHPFVYFEQPEFGGHCGFSLSGQRHSWADKRAYNFVMKYIQKTENS